jgi:serine/threonine protein kinase
MNDRRGNLFITSVATCPTDEEISELIEGRLDEVARQRVTAHLGGCDACRLLFAAVELPEPSPPDANARIEVGARVGRFVVLELVGKGGMGAVYAAYDPELDRKVALKVVRRDIYAAHLEARLKREAQALARLNHPHVITVYEVGNVGGQVFIAMEFVQAGTLRQWLKAETRGWREIVAHFCLAGEGLAAAHAVGLVHRDFKADNVLVGGDGRLRVTDFGLARVTTDDEALPVGTVSPDSPLNESMTAAGALVGTPAYMAPEQLDGSSVDGRADQFSFCASLYQALYGELPFAGDNVRAIRAAIALGRVRTPQRRSGVPRRLHAVLLRGLRPRRDDRFPSMEALLKKLKGPAQRRRAQLISVAAALILVGPLLVFMWQRGQPAWHAEVRQLGPTYEENSDWVDVSPDGKSLAYVSDRDGSGRIYVGPLMGSSSRAVTPPSHSALNYPRWTRDGGALLYRQGRISAFTIYRVTLADGQIEEVARGPHEAEDCGGALLFAEQKSPGCKNCPRLFTRSEGVTREIFRGAPAESVHQVRCNRAGTQAAFVLVPIAGESSSSLWLVGIDGTGLRQIVVDGTDPLYPFFHPDGRSLLYTLTRDKTQRVWEQSLAGGAPQRLTDGTFDVAPVVSPDGRFLIFNEDMSSAPMFAISNGRQTRLTSTIGDTLEYPVVTHEGRELIMEVAETAQLIRLGLADGSQQSLGDGRTPALAADDSVIYFTRHDVLAMPRGGGPARLVAHLPHDVSVFNMSFGGDGALHLALSTPEGRQAWRAALDGTVTREAPAPYFMVLPAPRGGWRVARAWKNGKSSLELIPPGGTLGSAMNTRLPVLPWVWDTSGLSLIGWDESRYVRVGVDGTVQTLFGRADIPVGVAVSPDGKTIYTSVSTARTRRQIVVNYGERPRPR